MRAGVGRIRHGSAGACKGFLQSQRPQALIEAMAESWDGYSFP